MSLSLLHFFLVLPLAAVPHVKIATIAEKQKSLRSIQYTFLIGNLNIRIQVSLWINFFMREFQCSKWRKCCRDVGKKIANNNYAYSINIKWDSVVQFWREIEVRSEKQLNILRAFIENYQWNGAACTNPI